MAWLGIFGTVAANFLLWRRGRITICGVTRRVVPKRLFLPLFIPAAIGLALHVWRGYR